MDNLEKIKPEVTLNIGGKLRKLILDYWAMALIQEDQGPTYLGNINYQRLPIADLIVLLWGMAASEDPELEGLSRIERKAIQRKIGKEWLGSKEDVEAAKDAVLKAIINAFSPEKDSSKNEQTTQTDSTGSV